MITILILDCLGTTLYREVPTPLQSPLHTIPVREMVEYYGEGWRKGRFVSRGTHHVQRDSPQEVTVEGETFVVH